MRPLRRLMDLSDRKALVTGGAGHIGLAIGDTLAELGATIGILDLDPRACHQRAQALGKWRKGRGLAFPCDLRDETATRSTIKDAISAMGGLDILVHCAAYVGTTHMPGWDAPFDQQTVAAWDAAMRVNLTCVMVMVQEARTALSASGHGSVILLSSIYGMVAPDLRLYDRTAMTHAAAYDASKGGLLQLTRYLSTVLAPRVRVNAISPGGLWRSQPQPFHQAYVSRTPLGRMATEEDMKGAIAYLASDLSAYVTGHNLVVDGGWTVW